MLKRPTFWLAVQSLVLIVFVITSGKLEPRIEPDTRSYILASKANSIPGALSTIRTVGYPLLLRALEQPVRPARLSYVRVTQAQFLLFVGAVWLFWIGLLRFLVAPWLALAASSALLWGESLKLLRPLLPDFLALALTIASMGLLLILVVRPGRWLWVSLMVTVFASYQLRPAGVFLVALVPALAFVLQRLRNRSSWMETSRFALLAAVLMAAPYLGFASLRWVSVGHFGLVSFGGYNAAGMALLFLDDDVVRELPKDLHILGRTIRRARLRRGWEVAGPDDDLTSLVREQYSKNIFRVAMPRARTQARRQLLAERGVQNSRHLDRSSYLVVEANRRLNKLSRSILLLRPRSYLRWIRNSITEGLGMLRNIALVKWPFLLLLIATPLALVRRRSKMTLLAVRTNPRARALIGLGALALGYFGAYLLLVALVSFPFPRYFISIVVFLPSLLFALLFEAWRLILVPRDA